MTKRWEHNFDALLAWLDPDRDQAGAKYEDIRHSLILIFSWRGCIDAEDLADETITRVINKVPELAPVYKGDPALYFYGVAKKMVLEVMRREPEAELPELDKLKDLHTEEPDGLEGVYQCLDQCLEALPDADRKLVLLYYQQEQPKIDSRKQLARSLNIGPNNLRVKMHRIRAVLHKCTVKCLQEAADHETD